MRHSFSSRTLLTLFALGILVACLAGCSSDKPNQPSVTKPDITTFTGAPSDVAPGDSVLLSYVVVRADSLKLYPSGQKMTIATTGSLYVKPTSVTTYTLRAYNAGGQDSATVSVSMNSVVPSITQLIAVEDTLVVGDSTQLTWIALRADSVKVNGGPKLLPATGGTVWYEPPQNGNLTMVAYNNYGSDTAQLNLRIEVPYVIQTVDGRSYFMGEFGSSIQNPQMRLRVRDFQAANLYKVWMKFQLLEGDGSISAESLQTAPAGNSLLTYDFSGTLGHATIRAMVPGYDTISLYVRASTIAPGVDFQGQYIRNGDTFGAVKEMNGSPLADTPDPNSWINYVDYESQLGVVGIVADLNHDSSSQDSEPIIGVILNTIYSGTTQSGWGIGSTVQTLLTEYGAVIPELDPTPPAAYRYFWPGLGLTAYTTTDASESAREVFEVHLVEAVPGVSSLPNLQRQR
ncbi:MAG: hypothetical protein IPH75_05910 [bacterium]|nr:hypothetical protein [bacterium]